MADHDKPQAQLQEKETAISIEREEYERALAAYQPDTEAEKKLVRKIDLFLLPMLWVMCKYSSPVLLAQCKMVRFSLFLQTS